MEAKHSPAIQNLFSSSKKQNDTKMTAAPTGGSSNRKANSRNKRKFSVDPNSALTNMKIENGIAQVSANTQTPGLMKTPSASTVKDVSGLAGLNEASQTQLAGNIDISQLNNAMSIEYSKVSNGVTHDLYLKDE